MYVCIMYVCMYLCTYVCIYVRMYVFFYLQHAPSQIVILHAWKDHCTRFTLYTISSYFIFTPMAVRVLFGFLHLLQSWRCFSLY